MRVAIVHEWFVNYAGSERVVEQLIALFPQADVFGLVDFMPDGDRAFLAGKPVTTTFLQRLPMARRRYAAYLPLMPLAIEQLDLRAYDLVLSSSHCVAKGVITSPEQLHLSYVHTPMRYAWDAQHEYLEGAGLRDGVKSILTRWLLHKMRMWDARTANGVDAFVANSSFIAQRIWKTYRRAARVIHPPVDVEAIPFGREREDFYLTVSRLVPYKRVDLIVEAFRELPDRKLLVIGDGPELARLRACAGPNVRLLGYQASPVVRDYLRRARAFLFAGREDFGIVLAEAQAAGAPVIALGRGGASEIVRDLDAARPTGVLFAEQTAPSLREAIRSFEVQRARIDAHECRANAQRFSVERFRAEMGQFIAAQCQGFKDAAPGNRPGAQPRLDASGVQPSRRAA